MAKRREERTSAATPPDHHKRAIQAFMRGDYDTAITAWTAALRGAPAEGMERTLAEAHFRRACLSLRRSPVQALADLQIAVELAPDDGLYTYHRGLAYHRNGNLERAIERYRECLRIDPDVEHQSRAAYMLCLAIGESGGAPDQDPAWELLTRTQREKLIPTDGAFAQAVKRLARGEYKPSEPYLYKASETHQGFANYYLGVIAWRRGAPEEAIKYWNAARAAGFDSSALRANLGIAYVHRAIAQLDSAAMIDSVTQALKSNPNLPIVRRLKERADFWAGIRAAGNGNWAAALNHWLSARNGTNTSQGSRGEADQDAAQTRRTASRELLANIALAYEHLEQWAEAAEAWREVVRRRPRRGESMWPRQHIANLWRHIDDLYARAGHLDRAAAVLGYAIKAQPDDLTLRLALVRRYIENESWRAAERATVRVLELSPGNLDALALYAQILDAGGDLDLMIDGWERVAQNKSLKYSGLAAERLIALYAERGDFFALIDDQGAAAADYARALEFCPPESALTSRLHARYGAILIATSPDLARAQFAQSDLSHPDIALTVIAAWHRAGKHDEAAQWLAKASNGRSPDTTFYVDLGTHILKEAPDAAAEYFQKVVAEGENAALLTRIAAAYDALDKSAEAYAYARRALKTDPAYGPAHLNLGLWDAARGRRPAANQHFQSALKWARVNHHNNVADGVEEAINLLAERHVPTLADILDTIDPDKTDIEMRRMFGGDSY